MEGSEYEFRVIACNKVGSSEPSAPSRTIVAKNPFGEFFVRRRSPLFIIVRLDKPGAPLDLAIESVGNDWIELTWQPPIRDGGSPITGYVIERRTPANYKWHVSKTDPKMSICSKCADFQGATEPIEGTKTRLHPLHTGHKYEFRVRAQNLAGLGEPSNSTKETEIREPIVGEKPRFIQELEPTTVVTGRSVTLTARVKGDPTPKFKW